jgi:hypothetical protein
MYQFLEWRDAYFLRKIRMKIAMQPLGMLAFPQMQLWRPPPRPPSE